MIDPAAMFATVAQAVSGAFGGPYVDGVVLDQTAATVDDGGSIATPGTPVGRSCMVQIDKASWEMQQAEGYAPGDMLFLILAATLSGRLDTDSRVRVNSGPHAGTWIVSGLSLDSVGTHWAGSGRAA